MHAEILKAKLEKFGHKHPVSALSMINLAGCMRVLGELEPAQKLYQEAASLQAELFGPTHPNTLTASNHCAVCLDMMGSSEAEALYLEVLGGREAVLGHRHPDTLQTVSSLN